MVNHKLNMVTCVRGYILNTEAVKISNACDWLQKGNKLAVSCIKNFLKYPVMLTLQAHVNQDHLFYKHKSVSDFLTGRNS